MAGALVERIWAWLHATFPERQIYVRSEGRVQFFTFGATLQATLAGLALIFLGWVAFASVNVIFKDRIIASKDHRYQQMQWTYENRVAYLQQSYDELNGALVSAEDHFKTTADELETKQNIVARLLGHKEAVDAGVGGSGAFNSSPATTVDSDAIPMAAGANSAMSSDGLGADMDTIPAKPATTGSSQLGAMPQQVEPQPRISRPTRASFLDDALSRFAANFLPTLTPAALRPPPDLPALHMLALQTNRLTQMSHTETAILEGVDHAISTRIGDLRTVLAEVGVDSGHLEQQAAGGEGGPFIPIQAMHIDGISDRNFTAAYAGASAHATELDTLFAALRHVPLTTPVHGTQFEITSSFGPRVDPFSGRLGFHAGLDFGGPWGSTVVSTAPGIVVWAGLRGGYGNLVEIDHGFGFRTRYGHLSAILVRVGTKVAKGSPIGRLGSTGHSTGPHVHYEVWLADTVRDPSRFIEAGRHVLQ